MARRKKSSARSSARRTARALRCITADGAGFRVRITFDMIQACYT